MPKALQNVTDATEGKKLADISIVSGELLNFIKNMNEIIFIVNMDRAIIAASDAAVYLLGIPDVNEAATAIDDFFPKIYLDAIFSKERLDDARDKSLTFPVKNVSGKEVLLETRFNWTSFGGSDALILTCRNIDWYTRTISELTERENRYRTIFQESPLGFVHVNSDGFITDCNSAFLKIFGFKRLEVLGVCLAEENELSLYQRFKRVAMDAVIGVSSCHESQFLLNGGHSGWVRVSFNPVRTDEQVFLGAIGIVEDITEAKKAMEEISFVSSHDTLTGLYNRAACENAISFLDKLEHLPMSVIYADLNCLKLANDAFGHQEGDLLLRSASSILNEHTTANDFTYRWGGDEFVMLLRNTDLTTAASRVKHISLACAAWKNEGLVRPSMALGYATKLFAEQDIRDILKAAEDDMYANKLHDGKNVRKTILGELENRMRNMMDGAVGKRCERLRLWGDWAIKNLDIKCDRDEIRMLCRYHDVGILASSEELDIIRSDQSRDKVAPPMQHMAVGYRIARSIAEITSVAENILAHHEWWDGMGYPNQLRGEEIPYASRLMSILDAVEGMIALALPGDVATLADALDSVKSCAGRQFDPDLVNEFLQKLLETPPDFIGDMEVLN